MEHYNDIILLPFSKNSSETMYVSMPTVTIMYRMYIVEAENNCQTLSLTFNFAIIYKCMEMSLL